MRPRAGGVAVVCTCIGFGVLAVAAPASAEWTRVTEVPVTEIFSVWVNGDTIAAGAATAVYLSTDAGASWHPSAEPVPGVAAIEALWVRDGRLYAGTFGQGVFVSDDLGANWSAFNQGLVGGLFDSQLDVVDFQVRGDDLYAATAGAGVYVRNLSGPSTWAHFGEVFEPNQASVLNSLALGGARLLASAGSNGMVFVRDPGDADWTVSNLDNVGIHAGLMAMTAAWTGTAWAVGTNAGVFHSAAGQEPWARFNPGLGPLTWTALAAEGPQLFAAFDTPVSAVIEESADDGAHWGNVETLTGAFVEKMATSGTTLYAARGDGLWRRPIGTASVPVENRLHRLRFALAGSQPFRDGARLRFDLPEAGVASIRVFDVLGRAAGDPIEGSWSSGPNEVTLDARRLPAGVYSAVLTAGSAREVVRLVHVR